MSSKNNFGLFLAAAGMELSWLFAVAGFLVAFFGNPPDVLLQAPLAFFLGAGLTRFLSNSSQRVITRLILHLLLPATLFLSALYYSGFREGAFLGSDWLAMLLQGTSSLAQAPRWGVAAMLTIIFWFGGVLLARRSLDHFSTALRFDAGVAAFIITFILAAVSGITALPSILLLFPFFLFSMLAIAMARRRQGDARGVFLQKYRGSGPILTFAIAVLLGGSAVVLLFFPLLARAAESGYAVLQYYGPRLADLLGRLILLLFGYGARLRRNLPAESSGDDLFIDPAAVPAGEASFWELLILWASVAVLGAVLLYMLARGLLFLLRWLWSGKDGSHGQQGFWSTLWLAINKILRRWRLYLQLVPGLICRFLRPLPGGESGIGAHFFTRLLRWGNISGLARLAAETPHEYARTLAKHFPALHAEIDLILNCYQDEVYGGIALEGYTNRQLHHAWRRLRSPRRWPARLHHRLFRRNCSK